jgi:hypothetical protein
MATGHQLQLKSKDAHLFYRYLHPANNFFKRLEKAQQITASLCAAFNLGLFRSEKKY